MYQFFEKLTKAYPEVDGNVAPNSFVKYCQYYSKGMGLPIIVMSILTAGVAVMEISLFGFMGQLIDWIVTNDPETLMTEHKNELIWMSIICVIALPLVTFLHALIVHQSLLGNYPMAIRWLSHRYLLKQSFEFYQNDFAGRIATKVMQNALSIREAILKMANILVYIATYFVTILVLLGTNSLYLMLVMIVWLIIYVALQMYFIPKLKAISSKQADERSIMTGRLVDSYTNIATVKLFSHTKREEQYAKESMDGFLQTVYIQMRYVTSLNVSIQTLNYVLVFVMAFLGLWLWTQSLVTAGLLSTAIGLALRINGMAQWIMWEISALFEHIGTIIDSMRTLSKPYLVEDKKDAKDLNATQCQIDLNNVQFSYDKSKDDVLNGLNLSIKAGEKIGLIGRSGAGKSTIVNLLLRFYDIKSGEILIDGQNISQVTQESLRQSIGMVTQDTSLLHRSVRENILYGCPDATEEQLINATKQAKAFEFIQDLTDPYGNTGFDAQVGERGVKLSGGQRQRIAIARVLLKNAPILILDEATSALDSEVEVQIQESFKELMVNKTVIAIAHRLSTIAQMDRLIVLDKGKIVEQGTHQELIAKDGIYAKLWAHQSGGFIAE
ncbi:ABC transporter ATP-binding protein [Marinicellulosiphila megalodicopiae]|uniref:ABC transporter ATP-binding protein n=1 Tax=Marinicellulosiphila megalodicopiae TaxID=2724896 RepID=UPI003BAEC2ED